MKNEQKAKKEKKEKKAKNVSDFLKWVSQLKEDEFVDEEIGWGPWFRGQQNAQWPLCPKLYREFGSYAEIKTSETEDEIREEFINRAPIFSTTLPDGDEVRAEWEWYFRMQHYGAPTRLLDWTEGALIALYFAVKDNPGFCDAVVWALNPYELNRRVLKRPDIFSPSAIGIPEDVRPSLQRWLPSRFTDMEGLPDNPIAIDLTHVVQRISTQHGCFTIHGTEEEALDKLGATYLRKCVIPAFKTQEIKKELRVCGIDEATIYPDLEGLSRSISDRWRPSDHKPPHQGVYTRICPSKVCPGGVGVFAISDIKRGTMLFEGDNEEMLWVKKKSVPNTPRKVRELYVDFAVSKGKMLGCPVSFNRLTVSWYLNEPNDGDPNIVCDPETYEFSAARDIKAGEELTVDYSTYSESSFSSKSRTPAKGRMREPRSK
jgi:hypothetical protein